jgi:hypothetical protein
MNNLSDHFQTAGVMAHMLRHKPDGYEAECAALLARTEGETRGRVQAYLEAGVAPVVIEALLEHGDTLAGDGIESTLVTQRHYGARWAAILLKPDMFVTEDMEKFEILKFTSLSAPKVQRVTIAERREKRRIRRGQ